MRYRGRLVILLIVIILLTALEYTFPGHPHNIVLYDKYIFRPYQSFRNLIFGWIPFSVGDILYVLGGLLVISIVVRWIYLSVKIKTHKHGLALSSLHNVIGLGVLYILFIVGWGANYYKPALGVFWHLNESVPEDSIITGFDQELINKLNAYAPHYHALSFAEVNKRSQEYYRKYTDVRTKLSGLRVKASMFNYLMQNLGIQGYYNPFTGEAQVNKYLPGFMLPFVICHEMAHQSGIAAEGDANLLSYVVGTRADDTTFNYSCYLNLWLYAQSRLRFRDSALAKKMRKQLNPITLAEIDTLRQIRHRYEGDMSRYSGKLYDEYLRMHDQKGGINSYDNVTLSAWAWEDKQQRNKDTIIKVP
jgi:hypothetical protein